MKIVLSFLLLCSVLLADRDGGPYIGLGYGSSKYESGGLYDELKKDTSDAATFYFGAYINKHLSVELAYVSFDAWHNNNGFEINDTQTLNFGVLSVSTLAHYAFFDDTLDFYARFGVGEVSLGGLSSDGFTFVSGGGVGFRFNEWLSMKVAYDIYSFNYDKDGDKVSDNSMQIDYIYSALEMQF